jgi:hypothetical protein
MTSFPFFDDPAFTADSDNRPPPLFKRIMKPGVPDLFYMGLAQPLPTLVNFAEQQSKLVGPFWPGNMPAPRRRNAADHRGGRGLLYRAILRGAAAYDPARFRPLCPRPQQGTGQGGQARCGERQCPAGSARQLEEA